VEKHKKSGRIPPKAGKLAAMPLQFLIDYHQNWHRCKNPQK